MAIGTPAYYYANAYNGGPGRGFEDASVVNNRMALDAQARNQKNQNEFQGGQNAADRFLQQQQNDASRAFQGGQAAADRQFQGAQNDANRSLQQQLGLAPIEFQREKFGAISPYITSILGGLTGAGGQANFGTPGGMAPPLPQITAAPVYSPQMTDQAVNMAKANNAQQTATNNRDLATRLAGQGFSSHSPLLASLQASNQMAQFGADAQAENNIRFGNAQANASQLLAGQKAQQQQWSDFNDQDIRRRQTQLSGVSSLLGALGGLL